MPIDMDNLLENPDAIDSNDEAAILALANGETEVELKNFDDDDNSGVAIPGLEKDGLSDKGKEAESKSVDNDDEKPAPIQSKDGKHTIPYNVLETTRTNLKNSNDQLGDANEEIERLKALVESGGDGATEEDLDDAANAAATPEEEFVRKNGMSSDDFKKEYGEGLTKSLLAQAEDSLDMRNQLSLLMGDHNSKVEEERVETSNTLQQAIDAIPELAAIQAEGGEKWKEAIGIDNALKVLPKFRDNLDDLDARFAAVAKEMGIESADKSTKQSKSDKKTDVLEAEDERLPASISDLPGGSSVSQSDRESVDEMDASDVGRLFESMTQAQQDEYLNNL